MSKTDEDRDNDLVAKNRAFWLTVGESLVKGSIEATDEVAKQLIGVVGVLEGLYFNAIAFSDLRDPTKYPVAKLAIQWPIYVVPVTLLLISLIAALAVFFPATFRMNLHSSEAAKLVFERIAARKLWLVRFSAVFLVLGVGAIVYATFWYLITPP